MNIASWTERTLERFGDFDALVHEDRTWTSGELADRAASLATGLSSLGVKPGDRVLVVLPNGPELLLAFPAVLRAGAVVVLMHPGATAAEIERIASHAEAAAIVTSSVLVARAPAGPRIRIAAGRATAGWESFEALVDRSAPLVEPVPRADDDLAQISYTSGVTGTPKGVTYTHGALIARLRYLAASNRKEAAAPATVFLAALPMAHTFGMILLFYRMVMKAKLVCLAEFEPRAVLEAIARHRVEVAPLVPMMCEMLLASPELARHDRSSLREIAIGGAPVTAGLVERMESTFGFRPTVGYGMTELPGITFNVGSAKPGSVGRVIPGVEARILDPEGRELPAGEVGEVVLKAPWMSGAYFRQSDDSATKVRDGWLYTGDLGYFDADKYLFLVGRSKEIIIQGGNKVSPQEVAEAVRSLAGVAECAVVGVSNDLLGEEVVACVVPAPGVTLTANAVLAHCRGALDPRKLPGRVVMLGELPKTEVGKVQTQKLREQIEKTRSAVTETELVTELRATAPAERPARLRAAIVQRLDDLGFSEDPTLPDATFDDLGVYSLAAVDLGNAIGTAVGRPMPATLTVSYPTIDAVVDFLMKELFGGAAPATSPLVTLHAGGDAAPVFCIHPSGGEITAYLGLRKLLGDRRPLYAIRSRAGGAPDTEHASLAEMAADYARIVREARPQGPYVLLGWSMGGVIAHAVAGELERAGAKVALVGVIDANAAQDTASELAQTVLALTGALYDVQSWAPNVAQVTLALRDPELRTLVAARAQPAELLAWCEARGLVAAGAVERERFEAMMKLRFRHFQLVSGHVRGQINAPMRAWWSSRALGDWSAHTLGGLRETVVGGDHFTLMMSPQLDRIAAELAEG